MWVGGSWWLVAMVFRVSEEDGKIRRVKKGRKKKKKAW